MLKKREGHLETLSRSNQSKYNKYSSQNPLSSDSFIRKKIPNKCIFIGIQRKNAEFWLLQLYFFHTLHNQSGTMQKTLYCVVETIVQLCTPGPRGATTVSVAVKVIYKISKSTIKPGKFYVKLNEISLSFEKKVQYVLVNLSNPLAMQPGELIYSVCR